MTILKTKPSACKKWLTRVFRSCIRVGTHEFNQIQAQKFIFAPPPPARVGLVVKHVIKLQWSSKAFTL
ncbi:hypothetical protein HanIR_Chr06g0294211 [Helianthus annuus]|nr:hypothetical protein HanIR_Chr06g0294211 [Helianthus annuus]